MPGARLRTESVMALDVHPTTGEVSAVMNTLTREMGVVGQPVPEAWAIEYWFQGGSEVNLDDGRTTLLVFWEEWCPYCKKELTQVDYNQFKAFTGSTSGQTEFPWITDGTYILA